MKALVLRLALGLALGVSATGTLAAAHNLPNAEARGAATTTLTGFFSDKTHPYGGGYIPTSSIRLGDTALNAQIFIGYPNELRAFEGHRAKNSEPVSVGLEGQRTNSEGEIRYFTVGDMQLMGYRIGNDKLSLAGVDKKLGVITFEGSFDKKFVRRPPRELHEWIGIALRGTLVVGGKAFEL